MVLLLGLGNPLFSDDGVGIHICRAVDERLGYCPHVDVAEGILQVSPSPTNGLSGTSVIMTLGLESEGPVGELVSLSGAQVTAASHTLAMPAAFRLNRLVIDLEGFGVRRSDIQIHAVTIKNASPGIGLSRPVAAAKARAVEIILSELRARATRDLRDQIASSFAKPMAPVASDRVAAG